VQGRQQARRPAELLESPAEPPLELLPEPPLELLPEPPLESPERQP